MTEMFYIVKFVRRKRVKKNKNQSFIHKNIILIKNAKNTEKETEQQRKKRYSVHKLKINFLKYINKRNIINWRNTIILN